MCVHPSVHTMSRFQQRRTIASEVVQGVDLSGKVVVITGGNGGLGFETALAIAGAGAHVILACRDAVKAEAAVQRILSKHVCTYMHHLLHGIEVTTYYVRHGPTTSVCMYVHHYTN